MIFMNSLINLANMPYAEIAKLLQEARKSKKESFLSQRKELEMLFNSAVLSADSAIKPPIDENDLRDRLFKLQRDLDKQRKVIASIREEAQPIFSCSSYSNDLLPPVKELIQKTPPCQIKAYQFLAKKDEEENLHRHLCSLENETVSLPLPRPVSISESDFKDQELKHLCNRLNTLNQAQWQSAAYLEKIENLLKS